MIRSDSGYTRNINNIFVATFLIILLLAMWQIRTILLLALAAVFLTIFITIPVRRLLKWSMPRGVAILVTLVGGIISIIVLALLVFPTLFEQFSVLFTDIIPLGLQQAIDYFNSGQLFEQFPFLENIVSPEQLNFEISDELVTQLASQVTTAVGQLGGSVIPLLGDVASGALSVLIVVFISMYLIAEPDRYVRGMIALTPLWYRDRTREILERLDDTVRGWLTVTGASMLLTGFGTGIGLALIGIEQWVALGVLAGVLSFIPNFGPILALIPSIAVAFVQAPSNVGLVVIIIYGISFLQSQVVGPILANENMNLAPVLILVGQIVFGVFFGFLGIMLAVPLTAIMVVLVQEIYVRDILGDNSSVKSEANEAEPDDDYYDDDDSFASPD